MLGDWMVGSLLNGASFRVDEQMIPGSFKWLSAVCCCCAAVVVDDRTVSAVRFAACRSRSATFGYVDSSTLTRVQLSSHFLGCSEMQFPRHSTTYDKTRNDDAYAEHTVEFVHFP
eukprot:scaffold516_cov175-Amphora_coffeaeformis.AAC.39